MLSLSPGSSCDICFEAFGYDQKQPCSIKCGHVYCRECVGVLALQDPPECPMCRQEFEYEECVRLHLDSDNVVGPSLADQGSGEEVQTAKKIWSSIMDISANGATELVVRQLVQDGEAFFKLKHENSYADLKAVFQIVNHLYEVKQKSRAKAASTKQATKELEDKVASLEAQNTELRKEKDSLEKALVKANELHRHEADLASAVEASLRSHFVQAKEKEGEITQYVYRPSVPISRPLTVVNCRLLKKIQHENADMRSELLQLRRGHLGRNGVLDEPKGAHEVSSSFTLPSGANFELDDSAAIDPSLNYFLTPLLGKSDHIAAILSSLPGMEDINELSEESQPNTDTEDVEPVRSHTPDYPVKPPKVEELKPKASSEGLRSFLKPPKPEPSGLSRTAPLKDHQRRERSHSSPSQPQSRAQSPFKPMVSSACPTPPIQTSASISSAFSAYGLDETQSVLQSRLQDILSDRRSPGPSSSLPVSSPNHFTSSFGSRDRDTMSYPSKGGSPPTQDTAPVKVSSASAQAKVLEDERRRRRGEELEHRRMLQAETDREIRRPSAPIPVPPSSSASGQAARNQPPSSYTQHYGQTPPNAYSQTQQQQNAPSRRGSTSASSLQAHYASRTNHPGASPSQEQLNGSAQRYPTTPSSTTRPSSIPVKKNSHPGYPSAPATNATAYI
ncbi:hypothetical protein D9619_010360 [Psilocybe cf. subviscida]|uniref:RING-type domain-containing protein n=1 Tax=Psilocybe cf. subviscida TaxID=2480587 RepID=A0A8H5AS37_9AGAR|nr:hypothetical protein D9619_010360 [Psilocybe cf. subviscida]